jgi:DNA-binding transcriptional LysR family regulator
MMDSSTLRRAAVFHAVGSAGGITAAGERLGRSPPTIHADLRRFEKDIGVALTERSGRGLRLTPMGRRVFEVVGRALSDLDMLSTFARTDAAADLPLRIGSVTAFGRYRLLPALLQRLPTERRLVLTTDSHDALLASLGRGEIDLALTYRPVIAAPLKTMWVAAENLVLVGARDEDAIAAARNGRLRFTTYDEHEYVFGRWFSDAIGAQPPMIHRHDHYGELEEALASVAAGRGATIAPADACRVVDLQPIGPSCHNDIYMCGTNKALNSTDAALIAASLRDTSAGDAGSAR